MHMCVCAYTYIRARECICMYIDNIIMDSYVLVIWNGLKWCVKVPLFLCTFVIFLKAIIRWGVNETHKPIDVRTCTHAVLSDVYMVSA